MRRRLIVLAAAAALFSASVLPTQAAPGPVPAPPGSTDASPGKVVNHAAGRYVVVMAADPLSVKYGKDGVTSSAAKTTAATLEKDQADALKSVGKKASDVTYSYTVALNGFATELTGAQADKLAAQKGVAAVLPDVMRYATATTTANAPAGPPGPGAGTADNAEPTFLGLTGRDGVWAKGYTGAGVVVGVIDTGVWPEHPSFADDGTFPAPAVTLENTAANPSCNFGNTAKNPLDAPFTCNNKLIGAREMLATYRAVSGQAPDEYDSARDDEGHGTHTASTAAGDANVKASIFGTSLGRVSGIAPRAQIIAYKALGNQGGYTSDLAAAIDQAVTDGVDVINYSIGGGPSLTSADDLAFLYAADAGVLVASSAGNSGPDASTIGGPASVPWVTTVAASTQPRFFQGTIRLGNGRTYTGASVTKGTGVLPLVDSVAAGSELCIPGALNPAVVTGKIVLCQRGAIGRAEKSLAVAQAGGAGMILYNTDNVDNLFTDNDMVASVQVDATPGLAIKAYIASSRRPTAQLITGQISTWKSAPSVAIFSSRGPDPVSEDIIKPDVIAPGVQVLAGASPTPDPGTGNAAGQLFQAIAGTSMSSPVVAGAYALIRQAHPDWSAATAKSALMTTAFQQVVDNDRKTPANPFSIGSGHIDLSGQKDAGTPFNPGLVYDAGFNDYLGFLCDADNSVFANPAATCASLASAGVPTQAENLNYPSIGVKSVPGTVTVKRTVTSVATKAPRGPSGPTVFKAQVKAPPGFTVTVSPQVLVLKPGESATFSVTITNVSATIGDWRFGSLTWKAPGYDVYSPIAVKASLFTAPLTAKGTGVDGSVSIPVKFGYTGSYTAGAHGLVPATVTPGTVVQDPDQTFDPTDGFSTAIPITVADAALLRVAMPPDAVADPAVDLDLYLYDPSGNQVASSTNGGTNEKIDVTSPANGTWTLYVHGWQAGSTGSAAFSLYSWLIPAAAGGGNLAITSAPTSATLGTTGTVTASWTGAAAAWNLGAISHTGDSGLMGLTLLEVDNR